jgi:hypothetical protein
MANSLLGTITSGECAEAKPNARGEPRDECRDEGATRGRGTKENILNASSWADLNIYYCSARLSNADLPPQDQRDA